MGLLNGVQKFTLGNLIEHKELADVIDEEDIPRHIARFGKRELEEARAVIADAIRIAREAERQFTFSPV